MEKVRRPTTVPKAARHFNLVVAALVFALMLVFAVWVVLSAFGNGNGGLSRAVAGSAIAAAALTLLGAVFDDWRSGEAFQQSWKALIGFSLFGIGTAVLMAG